MAKKIVTSSAKKSKPKTVVTKVASAKRSKLAKSIKPPTLEQKSAAKTPAKIADGIALEKPAKKTKLIRDSFTIPKDEYLLLGQLKHRTLLLDHQAKKSELLRAGIATLSKMTDAELVATLQSVLKIKTGRPMKSKGSNNKPTKAKSKG